MKNLKNNIFFKIGIIIFLILILLIPTSMVRGLIAERERTQERAINEISEKWAQGQVVAGPYITIPYDKYVKHYNAKDSTDTFVKLREHVHILPENLKITGNIIPEKRYRGIYEVVVYESELSIEGNFNDIDLASLEVEEKNLHLDKATINFGISDLKGIEKQISIQWNEETLAFNSGVANKDIVASGINASLNQPLSVNSVNNFKATIDLKGSQYLYFLPLGKTTDVALSSAWQTPSFNGEYLPDERLINSEGFNAKWNILHLNRNYPQQWKNNTYRVDYSNFGTDLLLPVDNYQKSDRVAKYAILFLGLTFLVFFFVEVLNKVFIHPIQYLLVGLALIVFYTLLLSFSEHIVFNLSYVLATVLTLVLITFYTYAILKSKQLATLICGILFILYSFIFTIIQLEDYALLLGSLGVFIILALVMYYSRKIDWYSIKLGGKEGEV